MQAAAEGAPGTGLTSRGCDMSCSWATAMLWVFLQGMRFLSENPAPRRCLSHWNSCCCAASALSATLLAA